MKVNEVVSAFREIIKRSTNEYEFPSDNLIFRGQANSAWGLVPKLWRNEYNKNSEDDLITKYKRRYMVAEDDIFQNLTDMQHYGMPTRLLDWTNNFLVALYFAVEKEDKADGKIFILDRQNLLDHNYINALRQLEKIICSIQGDYTPEKNKTLNTIREILKPFVPNDNEDSSFDNNEILQIFNKLLNTSDSNADSDSIGSLLKLENKYKQELCNILVKAIFFEPTNLNPRIIAQSSVFTAHFGNNEPNSLFINLKPFDWNKLLQEHNSNKNEYGINMAVIIIPKQWKQAIRYELKQYFGLHQAIIYPDDKEKVLAQYVECSLQESSTQEEDRSLKTLMTISY